MQGSYQRKASAKETIPYLLGVKTYVEEYLLSYDAAISSLQNDIKLGGKDRKVLKD